MYYLIDKTTKKIFGTCDCEPNMEDLKLRNETAFLSEPLDAEFSEIIVETSNDKVTGLSLKKK